MIRESNDSSLAQLVVDYEYSNASADKNPSSVAPTQKLITVVGPKIILHEGNGWSGWIACVNPMILDEASLTLGAILDAMRPHENSVFAGSEHLATKIGLTPRRVADHLKTLVDKGFISKPVREVQDGTLRKSTTKRLPKTKRQITDREVPTVPGERSWWYIKLPTLVLLPEELPPAAPRQTKAADVCRPARVRRDCRRMQG
jgi:hypothetical protein